MNINKTLSEGKFNIRNIRAIKIFPVVLILVSSIAFAESKNLYWVSIDLLDMHTEASPVSEIKHQWPLHTPLIKLTEKNDWCEVTDVNKTQVGYVLCNQLISDKQKIMNVFWDDPSIEHFLYVAEELERELSDDQLNEEYGVITKSYSRWVETHNIHEDSFEAQIIRPANQELDAMKALLSKGIKVHKDLKNAPTIDEPYFQKLSQLDAAEIYEVGDYLREIISKPLLPSIKPSLFKSHQDLLFAAATTSVDDLSVVANSKLSAKVVKPAFGVIGRGEAYVLAYWDIGELEVSLADPLALYSVARNGLVGKKMGKTFGLNSMYGECDFEMPLFVPHDLEADKNYPTIEYPLVAFYTPKIIPPKIIIITTSYRFQTESPEQETIKLHINALDLDVDGLPDMAITESAIPEYQGELKTWVSYFVNLNGEWYFAFSFVTPECT